MRFPHSFSPFHRRSAKQRAFTAGALGAQFFTERADAMFGHTERIIEAIQQGKSELQGTAAEQPDYVQLVRVHRASLLREMEEDAVLLELRGRMRQLAELQQLQQQYPELSSGVLSTPSEPPVKSKTEEEK